MTDAERLEAAHLGTLSNATFVERARTTVRFENGSLAVEETYVGRHGANASGISLWRNGTTDYPVPDLSLVEAHVWGNASFGVRRFVVEFPIRLGGRNATLRHTYTVEFGDVTVIRPPWSGDAIAGRTPGPLALSHRSQGGRSAPGSTRITSGDPVGA